MYASVHWIDIDVWPYMEGAKTKASTAWLVEYIEEAAVLRKDSRGM